MEVKEKGKEGGGWGVCVWYETLENENLKARTQRKEERKRRGKDQIAVDNFL